MVDITPAMSPHVRNPEMSPSAVVGRPEMSPGAVVGWPEMSPGAVVGWPEMSPGAVAGRPLMSPAIAVVESEIVNSNTKRIDLKRFMIEYS
jgi:hypothetical protein